MKKTLILLMIALPAMFATGRAYADDEFTDNNNIKYNITSDVEPRTVEVIAKDPLYSGKITIPKSVEYKDKTYAVTAIGERAFSGCSSLESVVISNSVKTIGFDAFNFCSSLESVEIGNSVETIRGFAFYACSSLKSVVIPNSVKMIEGRAFMFCNDLKSVVIPNSVETIELQAFAACSGLESVVIGNSVTYIEFHAFGDCSSLTEIIVKVETPPEIDGDVFGYSFNGAIHVLCNKEGTYKITSNWDSYAGKIVGDVSPDITLESADETMGKPAVTKENTCADNTATIEAAANPGYRFVQWNDGNTANPRTVPVEEDVTFIATFAPAEPPQVANPPVLLQDLEDAIICRGESHTFKIVAEGDNLSYEWYYGNERIKGANGNTYTITNAELRDYERYYVIVRNLVGESRASVYSKNVRLWVADQLPETLSFVSCPVQAITGQTYPIKLSGYPDVTQYSWSYRVGATLVAAQDAVAPTTVAPDTNDGVTFSPATGGVGQNETLATFGALSAGQGLLTVTLEHPCGARQVTQAIEVQYPTGVDQVAETAVRVFPNPTSGIIKVSGTTSNQIIRIVDITGSLKGKYPAQDGETTIDLTGYSKGTYLLQYNGKTVKTVRK